MDSRRSDGDLGKNFVYFRMDLCAVRTMMEAHPRLLKPLTAIMPSTTNFVAVASTTPTPTSDHDNMVIVQKRYVGKDR